MGRLDLDSASISNMTGVVEDFSVTPMHTDAATGSKETEYVHTQWATYFGYYNTIPELKKAIDMKAVWTIGKGFKADPLATTILDNISGWGVDTFNSILKNMIITYQIVGDAFCEIIRDDETGELINLKPLDPSTIKIVANDKGIIQKYVQVSKNKGLKTDMEFKPNQIFHLSKDRVADQIHGTGVVQAVEEYLKAFQESFKDTKLVQHRFSKPMHKFILDTDDETKIDALKSKFDNATNKGENIYIPKGAVEQELIAVPDNATLNTISWRNHVKDQFYQAVGIPQIILGNSGEFTESTAKIAYLAFEQSVEDSQMDIESQVWQQLQLRIELSFPASLRNELLTDEAKDDSSGGMMTGQINFQPNETTAGVGR